MDDTTALAYAEAIKKYVGRAEPGIVAQDGSAIS